MKRFLFWGLLASAMVGSCLYGSGVRSPSQDLEEVSELLAAPSAWASYLVTGHLNPIDVVETCPKCDYYNLLEGRTICNYCSGEEPPVDFSKIKR